MKELTATQRLRGMTMNGKLWCSILLAALLAGGCVLDPSRRFPPGATADQVRSAMGEPWAKTPRPEGGTQWTYPTGPLGRHTYVAEFGADGKLKTFEDILNEKGFTRLQIGKSTEQDVRALFGPPFRIIRLERLRQSAWDYRFTDTWTYPAIFSVIFNDQGVVASTMQQREFYGSDRATW